MSITVFAPPKVNLRLLVGPVRADGYHPLRSLMVALDGPADRVTVTRAAERAVRCPGIDGPANLAWTALDALEAEVGEPLPPLAVDIDKVLPSQAGVGGGSSDAAAVLRGANELLGLGLAPERLERAAAEEQAAAAHMAGENSVHLRAETGEVINLNAHRLSARRWRAAAAVSVFTLTGAVASVGVWAPTVGASAIAYARRHALPNASLKLTYELSLPPEDAFARTSGTPAAPASESTEAPGIGAS